MGKCWGYFLKSDPRQGYYHHTTIQQWPGILGKNNCIRESDYARL